MRYGFAVLGLVLLMAMATAAFAEATDGEIKLPEWPQQFEVLKGGRASMSIPVVKPGQVKVEITWQGVPLKVELVKPDGSVAASSGPKGSPVSISHTVTAVDPSKGLIWKVVITDPAKVSEPSTATVATGSVIATYPEVNISVLRQWVSQVGPQKMAALKTSASRSIAELQKAQVTAQVRKVAVEKPEQAQAWGDPHVDELIKTEKAEFAKTAAKLMAVTPRATAVKATPAAAQEVVKGKIPAINQKIAKEKLVIAATLTLVPFQQAAPAYGSDAMSFEVEGAPSDPKLIEFYFTMNPGMVRKGTTTAVIPKSTDPSKAYVSVKFPKEEDGMTQSPFTGNVFAKSYKPGNPPTLLATSEPQPFTFAKRPVPKIEWVNPEEAVLNQYMQVGAENATLKTIVHFVMPDGRDVTAGNSSYDPNYWPRTVRASLPTYSSRCTVPCVVYLENPHPDEPRFSNRVQFSLAATETLVQSMSASEGKPKDTINITGYGLKHVKRVHFEPNPGQESLQFPAAGNCGAKTSWDIISTSDYGMQVRIPWSINGIAGPLHGRVYFEDHGGNKKFEPVGGIPFVLKPEMVTAPIYALFSPLETTFTKKDGGDSFSQYGNVTMYQQNPNTTAVWISASHLSGMIFGHGGDDTYVMPWHPKNGWTIDSCKFTTSNSGSGDGNAYLAEWGQIPSGYKAKVHWWVDASWNFVNYTVTFYGKGPKGVPYW